MVVQLIGCSSANRVAIIHYIANVNAIGSQCHIVTIRSRAHGKHITATGHKFADFFYHGQLQLRHFIKTMSLSCRLLLTNILLVPGEMTVSRPKLAILSCKIFMMKVKPIISWQYAFEHIVVINHIIRNLRISKHQSDRIIPREFVFWRINRNTRHLLKLHFIHIHSHISHFGEYGAGLGIGNHLIGNIA